MLFAVCQSCVNMRFYGHCANFCVNFSGLFYVVFPCFLHCVRSSVQFCESHGRWRGCWRCLFLTCKALCTGCTLVCIMCISPRSGSSPVFMRSGVPSVAQFPCTICTFSASRAEGGGVVFICHVWFPFVMRFVGVLPFPFCF